MKEEGGRGALLVAVAQQLRAQALQAVRRFSLLHWHAPQLPYGHEGRLQRCYRAAEGHNHDGEGKQDVEAHQNLHHACERAVTCSEGRGGGWTFLCSDGGDGNGVKVEEHVALRAAAKCRDAAVCSRDVPSKQDL